MGNTARALVDSESEATSSWLPSWRSNKARFTDPEARVFRTGDVVLDCGAHIGIYTREALDSGAKLVVAIEPAPANLECLRRNMSREIAAGRVIVYAKGVWDKEDTLVLNEDPVNSAADSFVMKPENNVAVRKIPLTTIDRLVSELSISKVGMIKMDIKGATQRALYRRQTNTGRKQAAAGYFDRGEGR